MQKTNMNDAEKYLKNCEEDSVYTEARCWVNTYCRHLVYKIEAAREKNDEALVKKYKSLLSIAKKELYQNASNLEALKKIPQEYPSKIEELQRLLEGAD